MIRLQAMNVNWEGIRDTVNGRRIVIVIWDIISIVIVIQDIIITVTVIRDILNGTRTC